MSYNLVNPTTGDLTQVAGGTLYADLPIGSWVKNDSDKIPSGFLKAGDTISQTLYPELYAMYGGTVPYKADTSELSDYEKLNFPASLQVTAQYDGVIITTANDGGYLTFNINDHKVYIRTQSSGINAGTATVPIRKDDIIRIEGADGNYTLNVRYYKKSLIVKAKQVAVPADFMAAIDDVFKVSTPVSATNTEYTTNGSIIWKRSGNFVEVTFLNVAFASQTSGDVVLATGLPPSNNYSWSIIKSLVNANVQQGVAVNTNGDLTSLGGSTGGSSYYDSFTYLAAD